MLPRLSQQDKAPVLYHRFLTSRPLLGRPSDPFVPMLEAVARRAPEQQGDPFALSDPDHSKRIPRRTTLPHVMEFLREFRKVRNILIDVYDFDSQ
jgi:hypothetical protein